VPDSHTTAIFCTNIQQGASVAGVTWDDGSRLIGIPAFPLPIVQGVRFRLRDSSNEEPIRIRSAFLVLSVTTHGGAPGTLGATYAVMQNTSDTEPFSVSNPPLYDLGPGGAADTTGWTYLVEDGAPSWTNPTTPSTLNTALGTAVTEPVVGSTYYDISDFIPIFENYNSAGIVNMSIQIGVTVASYVLLYPYLLIEALDFFTGVAGSKGRERGDSRVRVVRDSRFGMPAWSDELVEDGDSPGVWVKPKHSDPEDPEREYIGNPREGVRDDDVPLE